MASSYLLTQHGLTAIAIEDLPPAVRSQLASVLDEPIETFDLIQTGKWTTDSPDHSLVEYSDP